MNDTSDIAVQIAKYKAIMGDWKVCHYWRNPRFLHTFLSAVNWECVVSDIFVKSAENVEEFFDKFDGSQSHLQPLADWILSSSDVNGRGSAPLPGPLDPTLDLSDLSSEQREEVMTNNPGRHYVWLDEVPVPVSRPKSPTPTPPAPPSPAASGEIELLTAEEAGFARPATPEPVGVESAEAQNTVPLVKQEPTSPKPVENGLGSSAENPFDLIDDEPGADSGQATVITASGNTGEACEESNGHPDITDSTSNNASGEGSANGAGTAILGEAGAAGHGQGDAQEGHAQPTGEAEGNEPEQRQALVQGQGEQTAGGVGTSGHAQAAATTANDGAAAIAAEGTGSRRSNRLRVKMEATAEQRTATPAVPAPTVARPVAKSKGKRKLNDGEVTHDAHSDARKRAKTGVKSGKRTIKPAPTTTTANTASNNAAIIPTNPADAFALKQIPLCARLAPLLDTHVYPEHEACARCKVLPGAVCVQADLDVACVGCGPFDCSFRVTPEEDKLRLAPLRRLRAACETGAFAQSPEVHADLQALLQANNLHRIGTAYEKADKVGDACVGEAGRRAVGVYNKLF